MIKKVLSLIAAVAAMAAAAAVCLVAAAYALYAMLRDPIGPAGAAAVVAAVAALVSLILAMVLAGKARGPRHGHAPPPEPGLAGRLIELAREKPIIAAGAAVAAGLVLVRNPKLVTTLLTVAMAGKAGKAAGKAEERRR